MYLMYGDRKALDYFMRERREDVCVFNFSSLSEGFITLDLLPRQRFDIDDSQEFDIAFANYIMNDNYRFDQFFQIIFPLYCGENVFVLTSSNEFFDILNESLFKLIQQRYNFISNPINSKEDIEYLREGSFSITGLYNLDIDKERFFKERMG